MSGISVNDLAPRTLDDRQYAYFRVSGDKPVDRVGDILGLQPIRQWNKGDTFIRNGHEFRRRNSLWALESKVSDKEPLAAHFAALLGRLEVVGEKLSPLQEDYACRIVCVSYNVQSFGFLLPAATQGRCAALGLDIEFDMYCLIDPHDEILKLRSLVSKTLEPGK